MGVFDRYMRDNDGLRRLVELLETTPLKRRQQLLEAGQAENSEIIELVSQYILTFRDIIELPQEQLIEVIAEMKPRAVAICALSVESPLREKILGSVMTNAQLEVNSYLDTVASPADIGQSRLAAIQVARSLEATDRLNLKRLPRNVGIETLVSQKTKKRVSIVDKPIKRESKDLAEFEAELENNDPNSKNEKSDFDNLDFDTLFGASEKKKTG